MDRGVTSVLDDIHAVALREHERRKRTIYVRPAHRTLSPEELERARQVVERSREQTIGEMRVYANPNVAPGTVFLMNATEGIARATQAIENLRLTRTAPQYEVQMQMPDAPPVAPNLGIGGEEVAPPDEDDVP